MNIAEIYEALFGKALDRTIGSQEEKKFRAMAKRRTRDKRINWNEYRNKQVRRKKYRKKFAPMEIAARRKHLVCPIPDYR